MTREKWQKMRTVMGYAAVSFAVLCFIFGICFDATRPFEFNWKKEIEAFCLGSWIIGPPIWFWFEYFTKPESLTSEERDELKNYQELSAKIWLAEIGLLLALFFGKAITGGEESSKPEHPRSHEHAPGSAQSTTAHSSSNPTEPLS